MHSQNHLYRFSVVTGQIAAATAAFVALSTHCLAAAPEPTPYEVGFARVDVTPEFPIRLSGFASRLTESVGVREHIYALRDGNPHSGRRRTRCAGNRR